MAVRILLLVCLTAFASADREANAVTPLEKVVQLLKKLSTQLETQGKKEAAEYDKYACFCKEQADEKLYAIETSTKKIDGLSAKEDALKKEISALNQEISDLVNKISQFGKDIRTETDKRKGENDAYVITEKDLNDAISACERAIEAMKDSKENVDGKVDLAQLSSSSPLLAAALLAQVGKQNPAAFEYSSNDIIATLDGLLAKFKANKVETDETEFNARAAHELKVQDMNNQKTFAEKDKAEKDEQVESQGETLAEATEEKGDETKAKNADDEFMKVLTSECETKAGDFDQRSSTRADEITAISKALGDLEANAMDNYKATGVAALQKPVSFLQLRGPKGALATQKVLDLLMAKSEQSNSPVLASLNMKLTLLQQSGIDHFVKVRQIIKDLLVKLDADAKSEATQKAYCDKNMKKQTEARDAANLKIEEKSSSIETSKADLAETKMAIADLNSAIAKNMKGLNEAAELRAEQKAQNQESITMSDAGKKSVEYALGVLKDFYSKAFIQKETYTPPNAGRDGQTVADMAPKEVFSGKYHGNQEASKGILGILEVISADFQRTKDKVEKDETESEKAYQEFKKTTDEDNDAKSKEVTAKEKKETDLKDAIVTFTDDKKDATKALENAENTLDDLKKMCVDGEESYAERVAKRKEEIDALKDALEILNNWKN